MFKKEVIFNDQWSDLNEITRTNLAKVIEYTIEKGTRFNIKLNNVKSFDNSIVFSWSGTRFNLIRFYLHYYKRTDSLEKKINTITNILKK